MRIVFMSMLISISFTQFSPGKLAKPHEMLEGNKFCQDCHTKGKLIDRDDCLDCHTILKNRIDSKLGYHSLLEEESCEFCHSDHNGLDFKMIYWKNGIENFDHKQTSYDLVDKHADLKCQKCHNQKFIQSEDVLIWKVDTRSSEFLNTTFLGLDTECISCHEDVHDSKLSNKCEECHDIKGWENARKNYNHDKTEFPLTEKHLEVDCAKCHFNSNSPEKLDLTFQQYLGRKCVDCHSDTHQNQFTNNCSQCHTTKSWKLPLPYNHEVSFSSALIESHVNVSCLQCHFSGENHDVVNPGVALTAKNSCLACHEDKHNNEFGTNCNDCHNYDNWKHIKKFDHSISKFNLNGKHKNVDCLKCHNTSNKDVLQYDFCGRCHENKHENQFDKYEYGLDCGKCHNENAWKPSTYTIESHQTSKFLLEGAHIAVPCFECHKPLTTLNNSIQYTFENIQCQSCHGDPHYSQFNTALGLIDCTTCHSTSEWKIYDFDHNKTQFPLDGKHSNVECKKCHFTDMVFFNGSFVSFKRYKPVKHSCSDCHSFEDFK